MKIFISIATYNEGENIEKLIRKIFDLEINNLHIIVIDDNSPDGTCEKVRSLQNEFSAIHLIERSGKLGYGTAHKAGFETAIKKGADVVISMDADLSHDPKDIPILIQQIEKGYDVVVGSRKVRDGKIVGWGLWRKFCSTGAATTARLLLGIKTKDVTNGFRAYKSRVFKIINLDKIESRGYSFLEEFIYLIEKMGLKVKEVPVVFLDREFGRSKLSRKEVVSFFYTIFKLKINSLFLILLGLTFFIGIWHALPMLNVVGDEMYFVGGVLRAIENHNLLPAPGDVPYGTLTYFLNYILISGFLLILLVCFKFNLSGLKDYLIQSPEIMYLIPRLLSALLAIVCLSLFNGILKREIKDLKTRIFILVLVFTNMLTVLILHTGKMWVLSTSLVLISFYYLYKALETKSDTDNNLNNKNIFLSILFSFLALANFIFYFFAFVNILLFLIFLGRDKRIKILKYSLTSLIVYLGIVALNFPSTKELIVGIFTQYNPVLVGAVMRENLSILATFWLNFKKVVVFFPLHLLTIAIVAKSRVRNKKLFIISTTYFFAYFISISLVATWPTEIYSYIRYMFPLGFLLGLIVASFNIKFKKAFYLIGLISVVYFIFTLYFLSAPTTYNQAHDWILENLNRENVVIVNNFLFLELPKNKKSYLSYQDKFCGTKCINVINKNLNGDIKYFTIDKSSKAVEDLPLENEIYYIDQYEYTGGGRELVARFFNKTENSFRLDGHMANYFDLDFFRIKNFGKDIYIYKNL